MLRLNPVQTFEGIQVFLTINDQQIQPGVPVYIPLNSSTNVTFELEIRNGFADAVFVRNESPSWNLIELSNGDEPINIYWDSRVHQLRDFFKIVAHSCCPEYKYLQGTLGRIMRPPEAFQGGETDIQWSWANDGGWTAFKAEYSFELDYFVIGDRHFYSSKLTIPIDVRIEGTSCNTSRQQTAVFFFHQGRDKDDKHDYVGAIADFTKATEIIPKYTDAIISRGGTEVEKGDYDGAIIDYTQAIELNPKNYMTYFLRACVKRKKGDLAGADEDFAKADKLQHP